MGLCRSESQIFESSYASEMEAFISATRGGAAPNLPEGVCRTLSDVLEALLRECRGMVLHYRLIDANVDELSTRRAQHGHESERFGLNFRGPRWALTSGFYQWQIDMCVSAVARRSLRDEPSDVVIVIPSVVSLGEISRCRRLFEQSLRANPVTAPGRIRLGCKIETPRSAELAEPISKMVDVVCIGMNDLTASIWAVSRSGWNVPRAMRRCTYLHSFMPSWVQRSSFVFWRETPG